MSTLDVMVQIGEASTLPDPTPPPTQTFEGYRWLHGVEGGRMPPPGMPEIVPPIEVHALEMTEVIHWLAYRLQQRFCPPYTGQRHRKAHTHDRAMTNKPQNGYDGGIRHRDYVNNRDLGSGITNTNYDKMQRGFGGSFFRAVDEGDRLRCDPGVHGLHAGAIKKYLSDFGDPNNPAAAVAMLAYVDGLVNFCIKEKWYVSAVSIGANDFADISYFPQAYIDGVQYPMVYPFLFDRPIYFRVEEAVTWKDTQLPNPLKIYKPVTSLLWRRPGLDS